MLMSSIPAEHFNPLLEQIERLEEALYNVQFEQHWLEAQTERQAIGVYLISICFDNLLSFIDFYIPQTSNEPRGYKGDGI